MVKCLIKKSTPTRTTGKLVGIFEPERKGAFVGLVGRPTQGRSLTVLSVVVIGGKVDRIESLGRLFRVVESIQKSTQCGVRVISLRVDT